MLELIHRIRRGVRDRGDRRLASCSARSSASATTSSRSRAASSCARRRSGSFTERTGTLASRSRTAASSCERLTRPGLHAIVDGSAVLIDLVTSGPYDLVRDTIVELGLPLVRLEQRRHRLEDLFRDGPDGPDPRGRQPATSRRSCHR
jgi:hypothetical protein